MFVMVLLACHGVIEPWHPCYVLKILFAVCCISTTADSLAQMACIHTRMHAKCPMLSSSAHVLVPRGTLLLFVMKHVLYRVPL